MFGMLEAILGFLNWVIGRRTDAASENGSLHAKVASLISNTPKYAYPVAGGTASTSSTSAVIAYSKNGKGFLLIGGFVAPYQNSYGILYVQVVADGVTGPLIAYGGEYIPPSFGPIAYKSSIQLKIWTTQPSGASNVSGSCIYFDFTY